MSGVFTLAVGPNGSGVEFGCSFKHFHGVEYNVLPPWNCLGGITMINKSCAAFGLAALVFAAPASALVTFTFDDPATDTLVTTYDFTADGAHITTTVTYDLTSISGTQAQFDVTIQNTTATSEPGTNRIVSFGVDVVTPTLTGASATNSLPTAGEWDATVTTNFPGFQSVDLCSYAGPNCSGGSSEGVAEGQTDTFHLTLLGDFASATPSPSVTFQSPFPGKFQAVGTAGRSFEVDACTGCEPTPVPDEGLPEPGTLALLALGVLGIYATGRRKIRR